MATLNYCGKQHLLCFCDKMNNCMKKLIPGCTSYYARHSVASIAADGQWFSAPLYSDGRTPNIFLNWVEKLRGAGGVSHAVGSELEKALLADLIPLSLCHPRAAPARPLLIHTVQKFCAGPKLD